MKKATATATRTTTTAAQKPRRSQKVTNAAEAVSKFETGRRLSKSDCKYLIDAVAARFEGSRTVAGDLLDILIVNAQNVREDLGRPFSDAEIKAYLGLSFCNDHNAKMAGMESLSTNTRINERCAKNCAVPGSICEACFSRAQMKTFPTMSKPLTLNYIILNYRVLPVEILPALNRQFVRIEAFGDVATVFQAVNYCNLCTANALNRAASFAAWSKNPDIWAAAFKRCGKPANLSFGVSSLFIDRAQKIAPRFSPFVDFVFTVYETEESAEAAGVSINCGARHCLSCLRCYESRKTRERTGDAVQVSELKK